MESIPFHRRSERLLRTGLFTHDGKNVVHDRLVDQRKGDDVEKDEKIENGEKKGYGGYTVSALHGSSIQSPAWR